MSICFQNVNFDPFVMVKVKGGQLCPTLSDTMDCSLPGSSVHGIWQARVLEWVAIAFSGPRAWEPQLWSLHALEPAAAKSLQSCPTLCDPIESSPPGSPIPGILQARTLSGLSFPSPMHESENWKWSRSVVSDSEQPHGLEPTRLLHPWGFPGKRTGVGCHCFLQHSW